MSPLVRVPVPRTPGPAVPPFRLDLHVHSRHSDDGAGSVLELARVAQRKGLGGFALTDHDTVAGHAEIEAAAERTGLLIVPGIEVTSAEGHLLALGVTQPIPRGLDAAETVERIDALGGLAVAAHPLRLFTGIGPTMLRERAAAGVLHAAEAANARERALVQQNTDRLCRSLGLTLTGGSDAHWVQDLGNAWTGFDEPLATVDDVLEALRRGASVAGGDATPRRHILLHRLRLGGRRLRRAFS